jgi:hypothetical protein
MQRDETGTDGEASESTYEEDALGIPDHTSGASEREPIPTDEQMPPGEHPRGADAWGTTAAEQRAGEPLSDRLDEELPDRAAGAEDEGFRLADDGAPDDTAELTSAGEPAAAEDPSAEESAVHIRSDAPGGFDGPDSYIVDDGEADV